MSEPTAADQEEVREADARASVLMKRGIALMADARPEAASEALACFDAALAIREALPLETSPLLRYGLAACWLNRADAMMRLGGPPQVAEAVRSCDQGILVLRTLPLAEDARFPRRLAMAHHNRGLFMQAQGRPAVEAVAAFEDALAVLEHDDALAVDDRVYLQAVVWTNLASTLAAGGSEERARAAALQAIELVAAAESDEPAAADVGLQARHVLCRTFAQRLSVLQAAGSDSMPDDVHEATDAVDDGLALIRRWEQKGVSRFRGMACDLFRFGSRVYLIYQPQFLQEFLDENLDPAASSDGYVADADLQAAAQELVALHARLYS